MDWINLLKDLGILTILSGLVTWLIKSIADNYLKKKFAAYEKELDNKSKEFELDLNQKIETHRYELEIIKLKDSNVYSKQVDIIETLYDKISTLQSKLLEMTALVKFEREDFEAEEKERIEESGKAYNEFLIYYRTNKIYFKKETTLLLDKLVANSYDTIDDYTFWRRWGMKGSDIAFEKIKNASDRMREDIPDILTKIEDDFRELIGVKYNRPNESNNTKTK